MIKFASAFISHMNLQTEIEEEQRIHESLAIVNRTFLDYPKFIRQHEITNVYNYYYVLDDKLKNTILHQELMIFWEIFSHYDSPSFSHYTIVKTCRILRIFNHLINSCSDQGYVYGELINSFNKYFSLPEYC